MIQEQRAVWWSPCRQDTGGHLQERNFGLITLANISTVHALSIQNYQRCVFTHNPLIHMSKLPSRGSSPRSWEVLTQHKPSHGGILSFTIHRFKHRVLHTAFSGLCPLGSKAPPPTSRLTRGKHPIACLNNLPSFSREPLKITSRDWHTGKLFWTAADVEKSVFEIVSFKRLWLFRY